MAHPSTIASLRSLIRRVDNYYWEKLEGSESSPEEIDHQARSVQAGDLLLESATLLYQAGRAATVTDANVLRGQANGAIAYVSEGIWSIARGLARYPGQYRARMEGPEHDWCEWFIGIAEGEMAYMRDMLDRDGVRQRMEKLVTALGLPEETTLALHHLYLAGPVTRDEFRLLAGLGKQGGNSLHARLLKFGLVTSLSEAALIQIAFPSGALGYLYPSLI
ncbi:MAG: hypothetical protein WCK63_04965 [Betaproteobacteria bacterium]